MKISVVVPVLNEEDSIRVLLDSLLAQTRVPDEIVVADGGSTDRTPQIIETYIARGLALRFIQEQGALPGRGRNIAAAHATSEWLAFIDAGIRPAPDWLEALAARVEREPEADAVYGAWQPVADSFFKECAAIAYVPPPSIEVDGRWMRPRFIASSLLRREIWRKVGGFPEHLRSAEDLLFMNEVERAGARIAYEPRAVVSWNIQPTLWRTFKRFTNYSRHNIRAGLWKDWQSAIFKRYAVLAGFALLSLAFGWRWLLLTAAVWLLFLAARGVVALRRQRGEFAASAGRNALRLAALVPLIAVLDAAAMIGTVNWIVRDKLRLAGGAIGLRNGA